jgi:hypothetical protein
VTENLHVDWQAGHRFHGTGRSVNANPMPFLVTGT